MNHFRLTIGTIFRFLQDYYNYSNLLGFLKTDNFSSLYNKCLQFFQNSRYSANNFQTRQKNGPEKQASIRSTDEPACYTFYKPYVRIMIQTKRSWINFRSCENRSYAKPGRAEIVYIASSSDLFRFATSEIPIFRPSNSDCSDLLRLIFQIQMCKEAVLSVWKLKTWLCRYGQTVASYRMTLMNWLQFCWFIIKLDILKLKKVEYCNWLDFIVWFISVIECAFHCCKIC